MNFIKNPLLILVLTCLTCVLDVQLFAKTKTLTINNATGVFVTGHVFCQKLEFFQLFKKDKTITIDFPDSCKQYVVSATVHGTSSRTLPSFEGKFSETNNITIFPYEIKPTLNPKSSQVNMKQRILRRRAKNL